MKIVTQICRPIISLADFAADIYLFPDDRSAFGDVAFKQNSLRYKIAAVHAPVNVLTPPPCRSILYGPQPVTLQPDNRNDRLMYSSLFCNNLSVNWAEAYSISHSCYHENNTTSIYPRNIENISAKWMLPSLQSHYSQIASFACALTQMLHRFYFLYLWRQKERKRDFFFFPLLHGLLVWKSNKTTG